MDIAENAIKIKHFCSIDLDRTPESEILGGEDINALPSLLGKEENPRNEHATYIRTTHKRTIKKSYKL